MKKNKIIAIVSGAVLAAALCGTLAACGEQTEVKTGSYSYANAWNPTGTPYGVAVSVAVKGDKIESVEITSKEEDMVSVSSGWENKAIWNDGVAAFLKNFEGMTVDQVKAVKVEVAANGQPNKVEGMDYVTGATQGSGRVILAVQNALGVDNTVTLKGEYKYANAWNPTGTPYGVAVDVSVYGGKITNVEITSKEEDMVSVSAGWENKAIWNDGVANFLASFKGMNVVALSKVVVETNAGGQPNAVSGMDYVTGATQGSGRVILAVQKALGIDTKVVVNSAASYALVHGAGYVGEAKATVKGDKLTALTLNEACFPTQVQAGADVAAADKVATQVLSHGSMVDATYYKHVSFGEYEFNYDLAKNAYVEVSTGKTFVEMAADEAFCKAYFEAVVKSEISVTVAGEEKTDILCKATLYKEDNGYWTNVKDKEGNAYSRWILNRDATVNYVLANGVDNLLSLVKSNDAVEDEKGANAKYWMDGEVSTGATWTDLNSDTTGKGYSSYAELILAAYDAACDY